MKDDPRPLRTIRRARLLTSLQLAERAGVSPVSRIRLTRSGVVAWLLVEVAALVMFSGAVTVPFHPDESQWIFTTRYLSFALRGDLDNPEWHNYWTLTQPPLARYVMGGTLMAADYDTERLNKPWDFTGTAQQNAADNRAPAPAMLLWARLPIALCAAASVVLLFLIGRHIAGTGAGVVATAWLAANPTARDLMTRAGADGLLIFLTLLALWLALRYRNARWLLIGAVVLGLALSAKLTALIALAAFCVTLCLDVRPLWRALLWAGAVGALAFTVFVAVNPALYADPVSGVWTMFAHRQAEMALQMTQYPASALPPGLPRLWVTAERALLTYATVGVLGGSLALAGLAVCIRHIRERASRTVVVWGVVCYVLIAASVGLDWDRYVLPLLPFAALWAGVGAVRVAALLPSLPILRRRAHGAGAC